MFSHNFGLASILLFLLLVFSPNSAFSSWAKEGFLLEQSHKKKTPSRGTPVSKEEMSKRAGSNGPLTEPITFDEADFKDPQQVQLNKKLDALIDISLASESSRFNAIEEERKDKKIAVKSKVAQEDLTVDKFAQMPPPILWTMATLGDHPSCRTVPLKDLHLAKNSAWFFDHLKPDKSLRYLKVAMCFLPEFNPETCMFSFNKICDMRFSLLYTLKLCSPGLPILDLGSGYGRMARNMLVLGAHVTLVDKSKLALEKAERHFQQHQEFLPPHYKTLYKLIESDINNPTAGYYKNKYWMVLCEQVLHFQTPEQIHSLLDRVYDVLYPGGLFFASTLTVFDNQKEVDCYLKGRRQGEELPLSRASSLKSRDLYIVLEELVALIQKHGFVVEEAINIDAGGNKTQRSCFDLNYPIAACVIARKPLKR